MKKPSTWLLIIVISVALIGCSNSIHIDNTSEGCYINTGGKVRLMTCPKPLPDLISEEKIDW